MINNPTKVIETKFDQKFKFTSNIVVEEQSDTGTIFLNIPRKLSADDMALDEKDLELIVGGWNPIRALGRQAKRAYNALITSDIEFGSFVGP